MVCGMRAADMHRYSRYWHDALYLQVNVGMLLQLWQIKYYTIYNIIVFIKIYRELLSSNLIVTDIFVAIMPYIG